VAASPSFFVVNSDGTGLTRLPVYSGSLAGPAQRVIGNNGLGPVRLLTNFQVSSVQDQALSDDGSRLVIDIGPQSGGVGAIYSVGSDGSKLAPVCAPRALNPASLSGVSPGGMISVYGLNFAGDGLVTAPGLPLPRSLAGVSLPCGDRNHRRRRPPGCRRRTR
jgi:hypothetical protein